MIFLRFLIIFFIIEQYANAYKVNILCVNDKWLTELKGSLEYKTSEKKELFAVINNHQYPVKTIDKYISDENINVGLGRNDISFYGEIKNGIFTAYVIETPPLKKGFLGIRSCLEEGNFNDCKLERYANGEELVLVSDEKNYFLDTSKIKKSSLDKSILQLVYVYGQIKGEKIIVENIVPILYRIGLADIE